MVILHIITSSSNWAGMEQYAFDLSKGMRERGHRLVFAINNDGDVVHPRFEPLGKVYLLSLKSKFDIRAVRALRKIFQKERPDIIHTHQPKNIFQAWFAKDRKTPIVHTLHFILRPSSPHRLYQWIFSRPLRMIAVSNLAKNKALEIYPRLDPDRIIPIFNSADPARLGTPPANTFSKISFPEQPIFPAAEAFGTAPQTKPREAAGTALKKNTLSSGGKHTGEKNSALGAFSALQSGYSCIRENKSVPVLGYAGRLTEEKGIGILLEAARMLHLENRSFLLKIAGTGDPFYVNTLKAKVKEYGMERKVSFEGFITNIGGFMDSVQIGILPTVIPEACSITVPEFMSRGKAVIATDNGGPAEYLENNLTGLLVPPGDVTQLHRALAHLLDRPNLREAVGIRAKEKFDRDLSFDRFIERTYRVYHSCLPS